MIQSFTAHGSRAVQQVKWEAEQPAPRQAAVIGTFAADDVLPAPLIDELSAGFDRLASAGPKDWHPGSNEQVLDLVHPSLFCYERGRSNVVAPAEQRPVPPSLPDGPWTGFASMGCPQLQRAGRLHGPPASADSFTASYYREARDSHWREARNYQLSAKGLAWLPAEFELSHDGESCSILSYINGLHPQQHPRLYAAIGQAFVKLAPLLAGALGRFRQKEPPLVEVPSPWYKVATPPHEFEDEVEEYKWNEEHRMFIEPKLPPFTPPLPVVPYTLQGRRLQVIVKLCSIELTPQKPRFAASSWHVEGMRDECIAATAIYYLSTENTSTAKLSFRQSVNEPDYEQNDDVGVRRMYGLGRDQALVQGLGACSTPERRALAWPNSLQHKVEPFELVDKTLPGHRRFLVFFLVDPAVRITSTADVPPQQIEWLLMELRMMPRFRRLPPDVLQRIMGFVLDASEEEDMEDDEKQDEDDDEEEETKVANLLGRNEEEEEEEEEEEKEEVEKQDEDEDKKTKVAHLIDRNAAEIRRAALMEERKYFVNESNSEHFERPFNLCEH